MREVASVEGAAEGDVLRERVAALTAALAAVTAERDRLRAAYERALEQLQLLRRRLYVAKAERIDARQLELAFAEAKARLDALGAALGEPASSPPPSPDGGAPNGRARPTPTGRRDLRDLAMPEERIELLDDALEATAERIGFEESCRLGYRRGGPVRIVVARATYKVAADADADADADAGRPTLTTVAAPKELLRRSLVAPSMLAHLLVAKYSLGLPFYRLAEQLAREGIDLDRGSMSRYAEDAGASLGAIVEAMAADAKATAFCLATDATGVAIQPTPLADRGRQPCRKGHVFVVLADKDHVFFEYHPKHTSAAVCAMLRGFGGYVQADAHAVYDALYRGESVAGTGADPPQEVGCWSHARRHFWEAASCKHVLGREALVRLRVLFARDAALGELPPSARHARRQREVRPLVDDFLAWARATYEVVRGERGLVATAFGYVVRQAAALRRFLDDGRLRLDNNAAERALRRVAVGRKNWLFFGSDDHATAAANLFSLLASCKLHGVEPEGYLRDVIRVVPYWPRDRFLALSPRDWTRTRARLDPDALGREVGPLPIPPPEEQPLPE